MALGEQWPERRTARGMSMDMDIDLQDELAALRERLTRRLHELHAEVVAAEDARRERGAQGGEVTDRKDEAAQLLMSEVGDAEQRRDVDEITLIERALRRIAGGTYGTCIDCGVPIALQRLQAQPAAERCAACQADAERSPRRPPSAH
jgi:RNA polymerase-binding transcription factor DksA